MPKPPEPPPPEAPPPQAPTGLPQAPRNLLGDSPSLYLRLHADNPVAWMPWGEAAFARARALDCPVLLSSGYASCHWCHVMARESFSDAETAEYLNRHFVSIKLDREEHPQIDQVYLEALAHLGQPGGWPLNMFLTPNRLPFLGGTYWPPVPLGGRPAFVDVVRAVAAAWHTPERRVRLENQAERLGDALRRSLERTAAPASEAGEVANENTGENTDEVASDTTESVMEPAISLGARGSDLLALAGAQLLERTDKTWGGFGGGGAQFPSAPSLEVLLRLGFREGTESHDLGAAAAEALGLTLDSAARGGLFDQVGGGFARYTVDAEWRIPHFEKMLYDNGLLLSLYARALPLLSEARARRARFVCEETVAFLQREMRLVMAGIPGSAFASSLDAESGGGKGGEGAAYVWTQSEVRRVAVAAGLGDGADLFCWWFDITAEGNFSGGKARGVSVPNRIRRTDSEDLENRYKPQLEPLRRALLAARMRRAQPRRDARVLTEWNAIAVCGLAEAGWRLDRADWVAQAAETAAFLAAACMHEGADGALRPSHAWSAEAGAHGEGLLEDYAWCARAELALFSATGEQAHRTRAARLADAALQDFGAADGGLWRTRATADAGLFLRLGGIEDGPVPAPVATAGEALAGLVAAGADTDGRFRVAAERLLAAWEPHLNSRPLHGAGLLAAADSLHAGACAVLVAEAGDAEGERALLEALRARARPSQVVLRATPGESLEPAHPAAEAVQAGTSPAIYLCLGNRCLPPIVVGAGGACDDAEPATTP